MGRGRAPCCDKSKVKKGPWSPAEDLRLITFIQKHGHSNWRALPKQSGLLRCGKSCRLRWINYLRPDVKRGSFSPEEEETIIKLHETLGNKWSKIASQLPGRTDNEIKNVWNTNLKKRLIMRKADSHQDEAKESSTICSFSPSSSPTPPSMSQGDQNREKGDENEDKEKDISTGIAGGQCSPTDEPKEAVSSCSCSSSSSGSKSSNSSQVDVSRPKDEMNSLFNFGNANNYQVNNAVYEETDHQEDSDKVIEIPWESDINFWDMLDNLDPSEPQEHKFEEPSQSQNSIKLFEEKHNKEVEFRDWLRELENDLGLVGTPGEEQHHRPNKAADAQVVTETDGCDDQMMMLMPEIDQGMAYFPMWPPSPHNFVF